MALIVLLRGVNVGGNRTFRPRDLANQLRSYDVVNIGAAGTFVVLKPPSATKLRALLLKKLPFTSEIILCKSEDFLKLMKSRPFKGKPKTKDVVHFVSFFANAKHIPTTVPITLPSQGPWCVKILASQNQFCLGMYRRTMKTIGYLGQIDKLLGTRATIRNWNTIEAIAKVLADSQD